MNICHNERFKRTQIRLNQGHADNRLPTESQIINLKIFLRKYCDENFRKFFNFETVNTSLTHNEFRVHI